MTSVNVKSLSYIATVAADWLTQPWYVAAGSWKLPRIDCVTNRTSCHRAVQRTHFKASDSLCGRRWFIMLHIINSFKLIVIALMMLKFYDLFDSTSCIINLPPDLLKLSFIDPFWSVTIQLQANVHWKILPELWMFSFLLRVWIDLLSGQRWFSFSRFGNILTLTHFVCKS